LRNLFERNHASSFGVELRALGSRIGVLLGAAVCLTFFRLAVDSGTPHTPRRIQPARFDGGKAEELTNDWVQLTIVPQLGGRLMQVQFGEAEINSPMRQLKPGASYALDTRWFPVRTSKGLRAVTAAGVIESPLVASLTANRLQLWASFGVFFAGKLNARVFDPNGVESNVIELQHVDPLQAVELNRTVSVPSRSGRVSIHLNHQPGLDRGGLGAAKIAEGRKDS
jgi:hypothetical protein